MLVPIDVASLPFPRSRETEVPFLGEEAESEAIQEAVLAQCVLHTVQRPCGEPGESAPEVDTSTLQRGKSTNEEQMDRFPAADVFLIQGICGRHRHGWLLEKPCGSEPWRYTSTALQKAHETRYGEGYPL